MDDPDDDGKVGYGRPPKHTRFKPGRSGNPKGRPKGVNNLRTDVRATLKSPVTITEARGKRKVSTQEAILLRLRERALKGDPKAIERLIILAGLHNDDREDADEATTLAIEDQEILNAFLAKRGAVKPSAGRKGGRK